MVSFWQYVIIFLDDIPVIIACNFQDADLPVYTQMYEYMNSHPENLVSTSDDGIQRVKYYLLQSML